MADNKSEIKDFENKKLKFQKKIFFFGSIAST